MSRASSPPSESAGTDTSDDESILSHISSWPCDYCGDDDHTVFDCPEAEEEQRKHRESPAALRLDPVVDYDPDED